MLRDVEGHHKTKKPFRAFMVRYFSLIILIQPFIATDLLSKKL